MGWQVPLNWFLVTHVSPQVLLSNCYMKYALPPVVVQAITLKKQQAHITWLIGREPPRAKHVVNDSLWSSPTCCTPVQSFDLHGLDSGLIPNPINLHDSSYLPYNLLNWTKTVVFETLLSHTNTVVLRCPVLLKSEWWETGPQDHNREAGNSNLNT